MMFKNDDNMLDALWVEKYRPQTMCDIVLHEDQKNFLNKCMAKQDIPHCLFSGPAGGGKTTISRILIESLIHNDSDLLMMNGSEATGIGTVRDTILGFVKSPPYNSKLKIVFIDEFDGTSQQYQQSLRNIMETYSDNARFICTCNYPSKIIDPILSRFQIFEMKTLSKGFVLEYAKKILDEEKIKYDKNSVELIIASLLPDVRKIINTLQKNTIEKKLKKINVDTIISTEKKICGQLIQIAENIGGDSQKETINRNVPQIMELLSSGIDPDFNHIYQTLFYHEGLAAWAKIKVNQYMNTHQSSMNPSIHFMAMVYDIIQAGMSFFSMFKTD